MSESRDKQSADEPGKKKDDPQRPLVHEGARPDRHLDSNEGADDRVEVVEPDGSSSPRNPEMTRRRAVDAGDFALLGTHRLPQTE